MDHNASCVQYMWISQVDLCAQHSRVHIELVPVDIAKAMVGSLSPSGGINSVVDADPKPCLVVPDEYPQKVFRTESYPSGVYIREGSCGGSWPVPWVT